MFVLSELLPFAEPTESERVSLSKTQMTQEAEQSLPVRWRVKNGLFAYVSSMGGDHGHSKLSMPDWRQWKTQGTPLEFTQQRLAARGLKDPWARSVFLPMCDIFLTSPYILCDLTLLPVFLSCHFPFVCSNEAWRYSGGFARAVTLSEVLLRGFKWGFAAFTVALAIEYTMFPPKKGGH